MYICVLYWVRSVNIFFPENGNVAHRAAKWENVNSVKREGYVRLTVSDLLILNNRVACSETKCMMFINK